MTCALQLEGGHVQAVEGTESQVHLRETKVLCEKLPALNGNFILHFYSSRTFLELFYEIVRFEELTDDFEELCIFLQWENSLSAHLGIVYFVGFHAYTCEREAFLKYKQEPRGIWGGEGGQRHIFSIR